MRRLILISTLVAAVVARPELYKETEDFQFSRSSSDDGTKSGFYGAQRGNMGGNYERAHNMDSLAQHQMSGLVRQIDGELGDATNKKTGSVYTAANSRGVFGSGHYDLSNLQGRNFHEGHHFDDSMARSSSLAQNADFTQQSFRSSDLSNTHLYNQRNNGFSGFRGYGNQRLSESQSAGGFNSGAYDYAGSAGQRATQPSQFGYQDQRHEQAYDESNSNFQSNSGSNVKTRVISGGMPVRVVLRPGTRLTIPVAAQTYDASNTASSFDRNAINSEAESLAGADGVSVSKPTSNAKHYESSYSYKKEWEKHDTKPVSLTDKSTISSYPKNSELYDEVQSAGSSNGQFRSYDSEAQRRYDSNLKTSSQSRYDTAHQKASSSSLRSGALAYKNINSRVSGDLDGVNNIDAQPQSFQSSYSYHKSWERQGDPYVIKPASSSSYDDGQTSQRLTSGNQRLYSNHQTGSNYRHSHQSSIGTVDCDEAEHQRVERSANYYDQNNAEQFEQGFSQELQSAWNDKYSQSQTANLEDFGQQTQDSFKDFGQQTQDHLDNFKDFGQQSQNQWENFENIGQQNQDARSLNKFKPSGNWQTLEHLPNIPKDQSRQEDLGQQTQNTWNTNVPQWDSQGTNIEQKGAESQVKPVWEQSSDDTQQVTGNWDSFYTDSGNYKPWMQTNSFQQSQWSLGMNTHEHDLGTNNNFSRNSHDTSSLQNLWNTIDNLEKVNAVIPKGNEYNISSESVNNLSQNQTNFQHSYQTWSQHETSETNPLHNFYEPHTTNNQQAQQPWQSTDKEINFLSSSVKPDIEKDYTRPFDIGRGDIESEDSAMYTNDKQNKTREEIEALSLTRETNKSSEDKNLQNKVHSGENLYVLSLSEQKKNKEEQFGIERSRNTSDSKIQNNFEVTQQEGIFKSASQNQNEHNILKINQNNTTSEQIQDEVLTPEEMEQPNYNRHQQENFDQQSQTAWAQNLEDFGQQSQTKWGEDFKELDQQTQTTRGKRIDNLDQKTDSIWGENLSEFSHQIQNPIEKNQEDLGQQIQSHWDKDLKDLGQQGQNPWDKNTEDFGQQTQSQWGEHFKESSQQTQTTGSKNEENLDQETQSNWGENLNEFTQQVQIPREKTQVDLGERIQSHWDKNSEDLGQQTQTQWGQNFGSVAHENMEDLSQHTQMQWGQNLGTVEHVNTEDLSQQTQTQWNENLKDLNQHSITKWENAPEDYKIAESGQTQNLEQPNEKHSRSFESHYIHVPQEIEHQHKKPEDISSPSEQITESELTTPKPGIWKSFKNKVSSWFKRSS